MISEYEIRDYVAHWMAALEKETPLEMIEALMRIKELMYNDLRKEILNRNVSGNWVHWWNDCARSLFYRTTWKNVFGFGKRKYEPDQFLPLEDIPEWIDDIKSSEKTSDLLEKNLGIGSGAFDDDMLMDKKERRKNKLVKGEEPPEITLLDVVFYNLCELWDIHLKSAFRWAAAEGVAGKDDYLKYSLHPYHGMIFTVAIASEVQELRKKYKKKIPYEVTQGSKWMNSKEEECYNMARSLVSKNLDERTMCLAMKRLFEELERRPEYIKSTFDDFICEKSFNKFILPTWGLDVFDQYHATGRCTEQLVKASERLMRPGIPNMYRTWSDEDLPVCSLMYALYDDMEFYRKQVWLTTGEELPRPGATPAAPTAAEVESGTQPLLSRFDGEELLAIHRRLTDAAYLECTGEEWLYVWGVSIHPHSRKAIAVPARRLVWSCEKGRKSALAEMIRLIKTSQCGNYWEKTARWFRYTNGEKPDAEQLKSQRLKGASAAAFKTLVLGA